jgi:hypothetical protein
MIEEAKRRRESHGAPTESTVHDYVEMFMLSADFNEDGRVNKQEFYKYYKVK